MDIAVVFELIGDYNEWRAVFDEDLPAREQFSELMIAGPLDNGQVAILAYGVDMEKMAAFMGTEEFAQRTSKFHGPPTIYQLSDITPPH